MCSEFIRCFLHLISNCAHLRHTGELTTHIIMLKDAFIQDHNLEVHRVSFPKRRGTFTLISSTRYTSMCQTRAHLWVDKIHKHIQDGKKRADMDHKECKKRII